MNRLTVAEHQRVPTNLKETLTATNGAQSAGLPATLFFQGEIFHQAILQPPSPTSWQCSSSVPTSAEDASGLTSLIHDAHYHSAGVGGLTLDDIVAQSLSLDPATSFDFHQFNQDADNHNQLQQSSLTAAVDTAILDPSFWDPTLVLDPSIASENPLFPTIQPSSSVSPVDSFLTLDTPSLASSVSSLSPKEFASSEFGDTPVPTKSHHVRENKPPGGTDSKKVTKDKMAPAMSVFSVKTSVSGRKRTRDAQATPEGNEDEILADKRRRNNAAAAKYRQKKVDRISELEDCVAEISKERDDLKLQLAKRDEEIRILREMLLGKK
ncbi:hypothetical protein PpBr36_07757 [Pyricularia pennisetigena]|uniref:hypothetical protein n=1 Tax=Pyricularia pennisetigena TaxID=1578925 RepID=UPI00115097E4|nr:hypothetical protein PpBr36_07757 [Pyricularia pennisetigena]TLS25329.1 hypothetical protein PpBr36_07757 [Pyricularia pennisetigena]